MSSSQLMKRTAITLTLTTATLLLLTQLAGYLLLAIFTAVANNQPDG